MKKKKNKFKEDELFGLLFGEIDDMLDNDEISPEEEGFMKGYLEDEFEE